MSEHRAKRPRVESKGNDTGNSFTTVPSHTGRFYTTKAFPTKPAPGFSKTALLANQDFGTISLDDFKGKYVVLFFYPLDFTFVCPTEITSFSDNVAKFRETNCEVVGVSVDSEHTHYAWVNTPRNKGGLGNINIPLIADVNRSMSRDYGVLMEEEGHTLRGLFVIDKKGIIRHISMNDPPVGRNTEEVLRLVKAYQFTDENEGVCPMNWTPGSKTIKDNQKQKNEYFSTVQ